MQIEHKQLIEGDKAVIYLNVYLEDIYEFGKENFSQAIKSKSIGKEIKQYIQKNVEYIKGAVIIVAINGILIGALTMNPQKEVHSLVGDIYSETKQEVALGENNDKDKELQKEEIEVKKNEDEQNTKVEKAENNKTTKPTQTPISINKSQAITNKPVTNNTTSVTTNKPQTTPKPTTNTTQSSATNNTTNESLPKVEQTKPQGIYIKLNTNGVIQEIELETYIIGVVAAEMPASFNIEALKAQAIAARTYAMKKTSKGVVLKNSTSDQVYKTTAQMKSNWGASYSTYYNKVKKAVNATAGLVLKYNGEYIDAQYSSMTNGKTELPEYVWSFSRPYLQCVSSEWDKQVSNFEVTKTFTYDKVSSALGQTITKDTNIEILSRTVSDRVDKIKIGDRTYTGTKVRSLLGLRSTDFTFDLKEDNIEITTKGFGHGVGMSQYGAHIAANQGYTYKQILNHYYVGAKIVSI